MVPRSLLRGLALLGCLLVEGEVWGQPGATTGTGGSAGGAPPADLEARVAKLEKQLAALSQEVAVLRKAPTPGARPAGRPEVKLFPLKNTNADEMVQTLERLLGGEPNAFRLATHQSTNTLLVQGRAEDLEVIEAVISRLEALPVPEKKAKTGLGTSATFGSSPGGTTSGTSSFGTTKGTFGSTLGGMTGTSTFGTRGTFGSTLGKPGTTTTPAEKEKGTAVKWEYKVVPVERTAGRASPIDGSKLEETLNKLGGEGWECVGTLADVVGGGATNRTNAFLIYKRPKK